MGHKARKTPPFPSQILVVEERPQNDEAYLTLYEEEEQLSAEEHAGREVAIYELKEIRRFVVTRDLVK